MFLFYAFFGLDKAGFDPQNRFVQSPILPPIALAILRALIALYCFTTITVCYSWLAHNVSSLNLQDVNLDPYTIVNGKAGIGQSFSFFTYLTFWSLGFYFSLSSLHTFMYALKGRTWLHSNWPRPLQLLHSFYYTSVTTFPFLVSIVFWGTMYAGPWPTGRFEQWINISVHGLNSFFALVEIVLPATEAMPFSHLGVLVVVLSLYLGLAYLTRWTQEFYVYEWMNPARGWEGVVLHVVAYSVGIVLIFLLVRCAIQLRNHLVERWSGDRRGGAGEGKMMELGDRSEVDLRWKEGGGVGAV